MYSTMISTLCVWLTAKIGKLKQKAKTCAAQYLTWYLGQLNEDFFSIRSQETYRCNQEHGVILDPGFV